MKFIIEIDNSKTIGLVLGILTVILSIIYNKIRKQRTRRKLDLKF